MAAHEIFDHRPKHVAGIDMRSRDDQAAAGLFGKLLFDALEIFGLPQGAQCSSENRFTGGTQSDDAIAPPNEKLKIEIGFQEPDLLADGRLRYPERLGGARHAETGTRDGTE